MQRLCRTILASAFVPKTSPPSRVRPIPLQQVRFARTFASPKQRASRVARALGVETKVVNVVDEDKLDVGKDGDQVLNFPEKEIGLEVEVGPGAIIREAEDLADKKQRHNISPNRYNRAQENLRDEIAEFYAHGVDPIFQDQMLKATRGLAKHVEIINVKVARDLRHYEVFWALPIAIQNQTFPDYLIEKIERYVLRTTGKLRFWLGTRLKSRRLPDVVFSRGFKVEDLNTFKIEPNSKKP